MSNGWYTRPFNRTTVIIFWLVVLAIFVGLYLYSPSLFNQVRQTPYQKTPYVNTPMN
jgi:hypothetical protein